MPVVAVELDLSTASFLDAVELEQEVGVKICPTKLTVGDALQSQPLLEGDDIADRRVLDSTQLRRIDGPRLKTRSGIDKRRGAQEAANVVGAERGLGHRCPLNLT